MKILREELFDEDVYNLSTRLDYSNEVINDALVKGIANANVEIQGYKVEDDEVVLAINVDSEINYLDSRTLKPLVIPVSFTENVEFTMNQDKAEELDIDYIDKELDLYELVYELIVVNIPFNYTESERNTPDEEEFYESNRPFANLFKK